MPAIAARASGPAAGSWSPDRPHYAVGSEKGLTVPLPDGTVLKYDRYFPTDVKTGKPARGHFPTIFQMTQYGRANTATNDNGDPYFVTRGYNWVIADARGTGDSTGYWTNFNP